MKTCSKCKIEKPYSEFNKNIKKKDGLQCRCKDCNKLNLQRHYIENKSKYLEKNKISKNRIQEWFLDYKQTLKCSVCGESHVACLDFHHINSDEKAYNVSSMGFQNKSKNSILKEISKCVVLCSNCHRKLHYNSGVAQLVE